MAVWELGKQFGLKVDDEVAMAIAMAKIPICPAATGQKKEEDLARRGPRMKHKAPKLGW